MLGICTVFGRFAAAFVVMLACPFATSGANGGVVADVKASVDWSSVKVVSEYWPFDTGHLPLRRSEPQPIGSAMSHVDAVWNGAFDEDWSTSSRRHPVGAAWAELNGSKALGYSDPALRLDHAIVAGPSGIWFDGEADAETQSDFVLRYSTFPSQYHTPRKVYISFDYTIEVSLRTEALGDVAQGSAKIWVMGLGASWVGGPPGSSGPSLGGAVINGGVFTPTPCTGTATFVANIPPPGHPLWSDHYNFEVVIELNAAASSVPSPGSLAVVVGAAVGAFRRRRRPTG